MKRHAEHWKPSRIAAAAGAVMITVGLVSCASPSPNSTDAAATGGSDLGTCGTVPTIAPNDPDGLLAGFDTDVIAEYNGFGTPIQKSAWADWKPDHAGPYTAAIVTTPPSNPFQVTMVGAIRDTLKAEGIEVISDQAASGFTDVPQQLQLLDQAIALKPDIILYQALASGPSVDAVTKAGEAGIPVIGVHNTIDSPFAVNVALNNVNQAAILAAGVFEAAGGSGTALRVRGIPGIQQDTDAETGFQAALAECPGIYVVAEVAGNYQNSLAQTAVLQYLATNPSGVDIVLQSGVMGLGVLEAFQQSGREPALMTDIGSSRGTIVLAHENPDIPFFGTGTPDAAIGQTMAEVAARVLAGQGPKINQIIRTPVVITQDNLDQVYDAGWDAADSTDASTKDDAYLTGDTLNPFFNDPDLTLSE